MPQIAYNNYTAGSLLKVDQICPRQQQSRGACTDPTGAYLSIHHIILIVDVSREVGGHELVLIPAGPQTGTHTSTPRHHYLHSKFVDTTPSCVKGDSPPGKQ